VGAGAKVLGTSSSAPTRIGANSVVYTRAAPFHRGRHPRQVVAAASRRERGPGPQNLPDPTMDELVRLVKRVEALEKGESQE